MPSRWPRRNGLRSYTIFNTQASKRSDIEITFIDFFSWATPDFSSLSRRLGNFSFSFFPRQKIVFCYFLGNYFRKTKAYQGTNQQATYIFKNTFTFSPHAPCKYLFPLFQNKLLYWIEYVNTLCTVIDVYDTNFQNSLKPLDFTIFNFRTLLCKKKENLTTVPSILAIMRDYAEIGHSAFFQLIVYYLERYVALENEEDIYLIWNGSLLRVKVQNAKFPCNFLHKLLNKLAKSVAAKRRLQGLITILKLNGLSGTIKISECINEVTRLQMPSDFISEWWNRISGGTVL